MCTCSRKWHLQLNILRKHYLMLRTFFLHKSIHTEKSNVLDALADTSDTLMSLLYDVHREFIQQKKYQFLIEGDAKVYELLHSLKCEYSDELQWLIPYPGDWHMLMNFQSALMKPYFDAGLKSLAAACGYPVAAIRHCSQLFKKHYFILESSEALYRTMLVKFLESERYSY